MKRILITGSADGLGQLAAIELVKQGHEVVLHARNESRAKEALSKVPGAKTALSGDLSDMEQTKRLADKVNALDRFDVIIHNAGVYQKPAQTILTVNTLAPYILTCLIEPPKRLVYLSSGDHLNGDPALTRLRADPPSARYSDSKLHDLILAKAVARKCPNVFSNGVDPGWVATKMGGAGAPDDLQKGYETQVWLAVSDDPSALVSGKYFHHQREAKYQFKADDMAVQNNFLRLCEQISGVTFGA
jgi:NAD(P)-dependent dehydrogenase (short-subunit alcohol dehydrogenase family)